MKFKALDTLRSLRDQELTSTQYALLCAAIARTDGHTGKVRASQALICEDANYCRDTWRKAGMDKILPRFFRIEQYGRRKNLFWLDMQNPSALDSTDDMQKSSALENPMQNPSVSMQNPSANMQKSSAPSDPSSDLSSDIPQANATTSLPTTGDIGDTGEIEPTAPLHNINTDAELRSLPKEERHADAARGVAEITEDWTMPLEDFDNETLREYIKKLKKDDYGMREAQWTGALADKARESFKEFNAQCRNNVKWAEVSNKWVDMVRSVTKPHYERMARHYIAQTQRKNHSAKDFIWNWPKISDTIIKQRISDVEGVILRRETMAVVNGEVVEEEVQAETVDEFMINRWRLEADKCAEEGDLEGEQYWRDKIEGVNGDA